MAEQQILKECFDKAWNNVCEGSCENYEAGQHTGECKVVHVKGWGHFSYCDEAIAEDRRRGLEVETLNILEMTNG